MTRNWILCTLQRGTDLGVSRPLSLTLSEYSSCRTRIVPGYLIRNGLANTQDCQTGLVARNRKPFGTVS